MRIVRFLTIAAVVLSSALAEEGPRSPFDDARDALRGYDDAVRSWKLERGHNVTLQLDDPCPEVLAGPSGERLAAAGAALEALIQSEPDHPEARLTLARLRQRQGRASDAVSLLERHVERHADDAAAWNALGVALARAGAEPERKLACYRKATELTPEDAEAWANLCNAYASAGMPDEAIAAGLTAARLRKHYVYAWMNLAVAYGLKGDEDREIEANLAAIRVPPEAEKCPFARFNLALIYEKKKKLPQAIAWYRDALRVGLPQGPGSREAALFHFNLARALYFNGDYLDSTFHATEAVRIDPTLPEPRSLLGHLFEKAGDPARSRQMFVAATRLLKEHGPSRPEAKLSHEP